MTPSNPSPSIVAADSRPISWYERILLNHLKADNQRAKDALATLGEVERILSELVKRTQPKDAYYAHLADLLSRFAPIKEQILSEILDVPEENP